MIPIFIQIGLTICAPLGLLMKRWTKRYSNTERCFQNLLSRKAQKEVWNLRQITYNDYNCQYSRILLNMVTDIRIPQKGEERHDQFSDY
jgi:hypothetical protein